MKKITKEMLRIYKPNSELDWMNYKIKRSELTYHHIQKRENGGKEAIENGAILMPVAHQYLHIIEYKEIDKYILINNIFKIINAQEKEPTEEQRGIIEYVLQEFEREHCNDRNSKNKILLKREYLKRY